METLTNLIAPYGVTGWIMAAAVIAVAAWLAVKLLSGIARLVVLALVLGIPGVSAALSAAWHYVHPVLGGLLP